MKEKQAAIFVGEVGQIFVLSGRHGVIVAPTAIWATELKVGDQLKLIKPDGDVLKVEVRGLEFVKTTRPLKRARGCPILIQTDNICREDVPVGSKLWLAN